MKKALLFTLIITLTSCASSDTWRDKTDKDIDVDSSIVVNNHANGKVYLVVDPTFGFAAEDSSQSTQDTDNDPEASPDLDFEVKAQLTEGGSSATIAEEGAKAVTDIVSNMLDKDRAPGTTPPVDADPPTIPDIPDTTDPPKDGTCDHYARPLMGALKAPAGSHQMVINGGQTASNVWRPTYRAVDVNVEIKIGQTVEAVFPTYRNKCVIQKRKEPYHEYGIGCQVGQFLIKYVKGNGRGVSVLLPESTWRDKDVNCDARKMAKGGYFTIY